MKVLLHKTLKRAYDNHMSTLLRSFIDDMRTTTYGEHPHEVVQQAALMAKGLIPALKNLRCKISKKTVIIGSSLQLSRDLSKKLQRLGCPCKIS